ncbi:MAG: hypothetical protein JWL62_2352 [Hyphomicrobiales bacterium]|jgi:hypothetical protein|nr:hypothetical protein [Hyphomicrobiales bacterium]
MPRLKRWTVAVLSGMIMAALFASAASADSMTFRLRSFSKYAVDVAFYSQNRQTVWPRPGRVYVLRDYNVTSYKLSCVSGERICYGGTVKGDAAHFWGVSSSGKQVCQECCYTCNGGNITPIINLNAR